MTNHLAAMNAHGLLAPDQMHLLQLILQKAGSYTDFVIHKFVLQKFSRGMQG